MHVTFLVGSNPPKINSILFRETLEWTSFILIDNYHSLKLFRVTVGVRYVCVSMSWTHLTDKADQGGTRHINGPWVEEYFLPRCIMTINRFLCWGSGGGGVVGGRACGKKAPASYWKRHCVPPPPCGFGYLFLQALMVRNSEQIIGVVRSFFCFQERRRL